MLSHSTENPESMPADSLYNGGLDTCFLTIAIKQVNVAHSYRG